MLHNKNLRNISIIAHVDHGKSTLADRFIEMSGLIKPGEHVDQILDSMDLEREKGITIKSQPIRLQFNELTLNLIDTPGHVDFSYEVSRALIACDGAILLVDATQGIQAQTFAHSYAAIEAGLEIIPVLNKIDSIDADIENATKQIFNLIGSMKMKYFKYQQKLVRVLKIYYLKFLILYLPRKENEGVNALIFDSFFDSYRGCCCIS
jgi:GTP-binding protein LepA